MIIWKRGANLRKKLKPDLNLEEIQRVLIEKVVELYNSGLSMRKIGIQLSLSQMKVRKILITAGAYTSQKFAGGLTPETANKIFVKIL